MTTEELKELELMKEFLIQNGIDPNSIPDEPETNSTSADQELLKEIELMKEFLASHPEQKAASKPASLLGLSAEALHYLLKPITYPEGIIRTGAAALGEGLMNTAGSVQHSLYGTPHSPKNIVTSEDVKNAFKGDATPSSTFLKRAGAPSVAATPLGFLADMAAGVPGLGIVSGANKALKAAKAGTALSAVNTAVKPYRYVVEGAHNTITKGLSHLGENIYRNAPSMKRVDQTLERYGKEPLSKELLDAGIWGKGSTISAQAEAWADELGLHRDGLLKAVTEEGAQAREHILQAGHREAEKKSQEILAFADQATNIVDKVKLVDLAEDTYFQTLGMFERLAIMKGGSVNMNRATQPARTKYLNEWVKHQDPELEELAGTLRTQLNKYDRFIPHEGSVTKTPALQWLKESFEKAPGALDAQASSRLQVNPPYFGVDPQRGYDLTTSLYNSLGNSAWDQFKRTPYGDRAVKALARGIRSESRKGADNIRKGVGAQLEKIDNLWGRLLTGAKTLHSEGLKETNKNMFSSVDGMLLPLGFVDHGGSLAISGKAAFPIAKKAADISKSNPFRTGFGALLYHSGKKRIPNTSLSPLAPALTNLGNKLSKDEKKK